MILQFSKLSHPVWVRGLKHIWKQRKSLKRKSRTPCGCVD
nr:MAG TPA: hypothetical protein [Caudoviricetes sp.]